MFHDRSGTARVSVYDPANSRDWKRTVAAQAIEHKPPVPVADVPLSMELTFFLPRPTSLPKRMRHHIRRPDVSNMLKAVEDALRGIVYKDDSQLVDVIVRKRYDPAPGVDIRVERVLDVPVAQAELAGARGRA
jgi:Holliday junction resolvase RusA-like endonuclease